MVTVAKSSKPSVVSMAFDLLRKGERAAKKVEENIEPTTAPRPDTKVPARKVPRTAVSKKAPAKKRGKK